MTQSEIQKHLADRVARYDRLTRWTAFEWVFDHRHELDGCTCDEDALANDEDNGVYECGVCRVALDDADRRDANTPDRTDPGYHLDNF